MRVLLLNQFAPPNPVPTARLLDDLASAFSALGWESVCLGEPSNHRRTGRKGLLRWFRDGLAHLKLLWSGLRSGPCDWVVCLSDPPGLIITASLLARIKGARLAHWVMDVYPQLAVQLGALSDDLPCHLLASAMRRAYRQCDLLIALDEDMREVLTHCGGSQVRILAPWPPLLTTTSITVDAPVHSSPFRTWLYSGNLGQAHEYRDLLDAQRLLETMPSPWQLIFQGGGSCRLEAQAYAAQLGLKHCHWRDYAPDNRLLGSMLDADVLIATQKPSMLGLLWPSKLAVMKLTGRPILWIGPENGQISADLRAASLMNGVFPIGRSGDIAEWISSLPMTEKSPSSKAIGILQSACQLRHQGLAHFTEWLRQFENETHHVA